MTATDERIDIETLKALRAHGAGVFRFVVPPECVGENGVGREGPGIYLTGWGPKSGSPHAYAEHRALTPTEARELADYLDRFDHVRFCCDGPEMADWPHTYRELIDRFYGALGRRLRLAINASSTRAHELDVLRAAITGEA